MMSKEILMVVDAVSNEKGVSREVIFEAIESALAMATRKLNEEEEIDCRVAVDRKTGEYETFRIWTVVADDEYVNEFTQYMLEQVQERDAALEVGSKIEEKIDNVPFGRIAAQTAKQVIVQKVRDAEREIVLNEYKDKIGEQKVQRAMSAYNSRLKNYVICFHIVNFTVLMKLRYFLHPLTNCWMKTLHRSLSHNPVWTRAG